MSFLVRSEEIRRAEREWEACGRILIVPDDFDFEALVLKIQKRLRGERVLL